MSHPAPPLSIRPPGNNYSRIGHHPQARCPFLARPKAAPPLILHAQAPSNPPHTPAPAAHPHHRRPASRPAALWPARPPRRCSAPAAPATSHRCWMTRATAHTTGAPPQEVSLRACLHGQRPTRGVDGAYADVRTCALMLAGNVLPPALNLNWFRPSLPVALPRPSPGGSLPHTPPRKVTSAPDSQSYQALQRTSANPWRTSGGVPALPDSPSRHLTPQPPQHLPYGPLSPQRAGVAAASAHGHSPHGSNQGQGQVPIPPIPTAWGTSGGGAGPAAGGGGGHSTQTVSASGGVQGPGAAGLGPGPGPGHGMGYGLPPAPPQVLTNARQRRDSASSSDSHSPGVRPGGLPVPRGAGFFMFSAACGKPAPRRRNAVPSSGPHPTLFVSALFPFRTWPCFHMTQHADFHRCTTPPWRVRAAAAPSAPPPWAAPPSTARPPPPPRPPHPPAPTCDPSRRVSLLANHYTKSTLRLCMRKVADAMGAWSRAASLHMDVAGRASCAGARARRAPTCWCTPVPVRRIGTNDGSQWLVKPHINYVALPSAISQCHAGADAPNGSLATRYSRLSLGPSTELGQGQGQAQGHSSPAQGLPPSSSLGRQQPSNSGGSARQLLGAFAAVSAEKGFPLKSAVCCPNVSDAHCCACYGELSRR